MKAYYDGKPSVFEAVGNGNYLYRYSIEKVEAPALGYDADGSETDTRTQFVCEEVTVMPPLTSNRITEAVISERWSNNVEQKLVNEYNAVKLGLYGSDESEEAQKCIEAYKTFLAERNAIKEQINIDCKANGIA